MADNQNVSSAATYDVATDKVTYSGDADRNVQLVRFVQVTGSEGSKTVVDLPGDATDGQLVNLGANNDVTVTSGSITATQGTATNLNATVTLTAGTATNEVVGDVASNVAITANPVSVGGRASSAVPTAVGADGRAVDNWLDRSGGQVVNGRDAHDAARDTNSNPIAIGGNASAAAPSDVSADNDAVRAWFLRNGAQATVITAAGALVGGDATNGLDVDVTRLPALVAGTANIGDVDVLTVPSDPFGANADAASGTGSISAKLRQLCTALVSEDVARTDGGGGLMILGYRNDANASEIGSDLDAGFISLDIAGNVNVKSRKHKVKVAVTSGGLTTTATAYTAGDQVGTQFTFAGCARDSGGYGTIVGVTLISAADTIGPMDLILFNQSVTLSGGDNGAFAISDADALFYEAYIPLSSYYDIGNNRICYANNLAIPYKCNATSLFGGLITRAAIAATPFAAVTDIQVNLYVELD